MAFRHGWRKRTLQALLVGLAVSALMLAVYIYQPGLAQQLDRRLYDMFLLRADRPAPHPGIAIIDIDEPSLEALGQWPWPRSLMAVLLEKMNQYQVVASGWDILLSEPDRTSPVQIQGYLKEHFNIDMGFSNLPAQFADNDALLAGLLEQSRVVLGMYMRFAGDANQQMVNQPPDPPRIVELTGPDAPPPTAGLFQATSATMPLPLFSAVTPTGSINVSPDRDGMVRSVPLVISLNGKLYANLSLRTLMLAMGARNLVLHSQATGLNIKLGSYNIPVRPETEMMVAYLGPGRTFPTYSAKDVVQGVVDPALLNGRIVFVGSSAPGLQDLRSTPFDYFYPGVEVHATVVDNILSQRFLALPSWTPALQVAMLFIAGLMCSIFFSLSRMWVYLPLALLVIGGAVYGSWYLFNQGLYISPVYVVVNVVLVGLLVVCLRIWQEESHKRQLQQAFGRYVAPEIVARIADKPQDLLAGEEREVSILFTDLRGFTSLSEKLTPQQVVSMLNDYFTPMTNLVRSNKGTLDKFIGDALMAFWNAPHNVENHWSLALNTVMGMHQAMGGLNRYVMDNYGIYLDMGAGLHCGPVYVGNMGSSELLDYTIIGDNVNLASRLEGLTSLFGVNTVVSQSIRERCGEEFAFVPLDHVRVKGKKEPVAVYYACQHQEHEQRADEFALYLQAKNLYDTMDFSTAEQAFTKLMELFPTRKLYAVYQERCQWFSKQPPSDWDGTWSLSSK